MLSKHATKAALLFDRESVISIEKKFKGMDLLNAILLKM
jgi:hypothetical protein